jgi:hypothetical protein
MNVTAVSPLLMNSLHVPPLAGTSLNAVSPSFPNPATLLLQDQVTLSNNPLVKTLTQILISEQSQQTQGATVSLFTPLATSPGEAGTLSTLTTQATFAQADANLAAQTAATSEAVTPNPAPNTAASTDPAVADANAVLAAAATPANPSALEASLLLANQGPGSAALLAGGLVGIWPGPGPGASEIVASQAMQKKESLLVKKAAALSSATDTAGHPAEGGAALAAYTPAGRHPKGESGNLWSSVDILD